MRICRLVINHNTNVRLMGKIFEAMPEDAKLLRTEYVVDCYRHQFWFSSKDFPEVEEGSIVPETYAIIYPDKEGRETIKLEIG